MKKSLAILMALLAFILIIAGCATTSDAGNGSEDVSGQKQTVAPVSTSTAELISSISTSAATEPADAEREPETSVKLKKKSLEELFDETTSWPDNFNRMPAVMQKAEDSDVWYEFVDMVNSYASLDELENYLRDWWGTYGWTPEFYAACHNYYFIKASEILDAAVSEEDIQNVYACFDRCFASTLRGAMQYPDRLDLWCGFVHAANLIGDHANAEQVCMLIFERMSTNGNIWYWTCNEPFYADDAAARGREFTGIMHDYICEWLDFEDGVSYAFPVSQKLVEFFPSEAVALNDLSLCYRLLDDFENARICLNRAYEAAPDDFVVIGNLAYLCEDMGEYDAAYDYALMLAKSGEPEYVDQGIRLCAEINQLKNSEQ